MLSIIAALCLAAAPAEGLQVPPGFVVTEYAGSDLANDISCMTVDAAGRVIVAGRGYVRLLLDGRAVEMATGIVDAPMGLFREGDTLFVVGDGGLWKHALSPDGLKSIRRELIRKARTGGEHDAHAVMRGPDGWLYWLCGNTAGVDATWVNSPTSPVKEPKAGCVVRFSPDFAKCEVVAYTYIPKIGM